MTAMLLGKKIGMTRVYDKNGVIVPVTVIQAGPCRVTQVKTEDTDGYCAIQMGMNEVKPSRRTKPAIGHAKKSDTVPYKFVREQRLESAPAVESGAELTVEMFEGIDWVDVTGTSKGRGFAGVVKRWGFKGQQASHGVERKHRSPGSIKGNAGSAGCSRGLRKGKKMSGHMGVDRKTSMNHKVISIDKDNNLILVKGPVAGPNNGLVMVRKAVKKG